MWVKICGIRSQDDLRAGIEAGADALGFISGTRAFSEDALSPRDVRALVSLVPPDIETVLVTHLQKREDIKELLLYSLCRTAQVQPGVPFPSTISTVHIDNSLPSLPRCDRLLLDSRTPNRLGGTGQTHDWNISASVRKKFSGRCILAGGLGPHNVAEAIGQVQPWGVDANSGLEDARGNKDPFLCKEWVRIAKASTEPSR